MCKNSYIYGSFKTGYPNEKGIGHYCNTLFVADRIKDKDLYYLYVMHQERSIDEPPTEHRLYRAIVDLGFRARSNFRVGIMPGKVGSEGILRLNMWARSGV